MGDERPARGVSSGKILLTAGIGTLLYFAHAAFVPIALALLFALVLSAPVEALRKRGIPRALSGVVLIATVAGFLGTGIGAAWAPGQQWIADAPKTARIVAQRFAPLVRFAHRLDTLGKSAENIALPATGPATPAPAATAPSSTSMVFLDLTRLALVSLLTCIIVTLFLLAGGPPMMARMTSAFFDDLNAARVLLLINQVRSEVGRFYVTTALINVGLGTATWVVMLLCGMPTPYLWGVMAALLNFIPYLGAATTLGVVTLVAFVTFSGLGHVAVVAGSYLALTTIEGQIVQPLLVGRRLDINPLLVFLGLWFGGLYWGIPGILLATPLLVALKVIAENAENGAALSEFLSPNDSSSASRKRSGQWMHGMQIGRSRTPRKPAPRHS